MWFKSLFKSDSKETPKKSQKSLPSSSQPPPSLSSSSPAAAAASLSSSSPATVSTKPDHPLRMACPGGERVVLIASGSSGGGGGGGNNNNSVTGRNCAVCDKNKANPCRDLCQACYNKWVASGKKRCARCRKRKVDGKYDLCVTCYGEWKLRTQEDDFAGMPADEAAELRELCVEVLCSDRDVVAKKLSESELWADYAVPNESLEETCPICLTELCDEPCVKLNCCTHVFHKDCIRGCLGQATYIKCPLCSAIVGTYVGSQPPGKMLVSFQKARTIEGCRPGSGLIYVTYEIPGGRQGKNHPHPGKPFTGTFREAYFPNTPEGRRVVRMMKVAFKRKLVFTVGTSVTSGKENTVVWNGIHHKTHPGGGAERHGYPDPTYLKRVEEELASFGVTAPPLPVKKDTHDGQSIEGFVSMAGGQWNKMNVYDGARVLNKSPSPVGSPKPVDDPSKEAKAAPAPAPADADEGHGEKVIDKGSEKQCDGPVEEERASVEHKNESDVTDDVKDANPATLESSSGDGKDGKKKDKKKKKKKKKNEKVEEEEEEEEEGGGGGGGDVKEKEEEKEPPRKKGMCENDSVEKKEEDKPEDEGCGEIADEEKKIEANSEDGKKLGENEENRKDDKHVLEEEKEEPTKKECMCEDNVETKEQGMEKTDDSEKKDEKEMDEGSKPEPEDGKELSESQEKKVDKKKKKKKKDKKVEGCKAEEEPPVKAADDSEDVSNAKGVALSNSEGCGDNDEKKERKKKKKKDKKIEDEGREG